MATINNFEDLKVWQKERVLCQQIFTITLTDKFSKDFSLKDQINRSSGSVMDNIAEGFWQKRKYGVYKFSYIFKWISIGMQIATVQGI